MSISLDTNLYFGPGGNVVIAAGRTLAIDTINTNASTDLSLSPTGSNVTIIAGKILKTDTINPTTAGATITFGAAVSVPNGMNLNTTYTNNKALKYNTSVKGNLTGNLTGTYYITRVGNLCIVHIPVLTVVTARTTNISLAVPDYVANPTPIQFYYLNCIRHWKCSQSSLQYTWVDYNSNVHSNWYRLRCECLPNSLDSLGFTR